ncbi:GAF domain-containing protein [Parasphingorhabdus pacifica]
MLNLLDSSTALRGLAELVRDRCGAHIGLAGPAESDRLLVLRQWAGTRATGLHDLHVGMGLGLGGRAFAESKPVWVDDYCASNLITHDFDRPISADGIHSMLAVPMVRGGRIHGVLYAAARDITGFGDRQLDMAVDLADSGALALQTASTAQRQRESATVAERRRIASALHDSVGAQLFRIGAELRDLRNDAAGESSTLLERLTSLETQLSEAASAFRDSVHALDHDEPNGELGAALVSACAAFERRTGITAQAIEVDAVGPDRHRTRTLLATAREALLNVEKHARARSVLITLLALDGGVALSIVDDGVGWSPDCAASGGIGLSRMAAQVEELGGVFSVVTNEDGGLTVRAWVPLS